MMITRYKLKRWGLMLVLQCGLVAPVGAISFFNSCEGTDEPKPAWVSNPGYAEAGSFVGIGMATREGRDAEQQNRMATENAYHNLAQQIEVTITAVNAQKVNVTNQRVQKDESSSVTVSASEVLREVKIKGRWLDVSSCTLHLLMSVSKATIEQTKKEKVMRTRLSQVKSLLTTGGDALKTPDVGLRRKALEEAQWLLAEIDFSVLSDELSKEVYGKQLDDIRAGLSRESLQTEGRTALVVLAKGARLPEAIVSNLYDRAIAQEATLVRLSDCDSEESCKQRAKEKGFSQLTVYTLATQMATSSLGALTGTLTVTKIVHNLARGNVQKGPDTVQADVVGWNRSAMDWPLAMEKAWGQLTKKQE